MAGKIKKPNAVQRLLHRFLMLRPVTAFFAPRVHHWDKALLRLTGGRYTIAAILGWDIVQLTTIGARTSQPSTMPLVGVIDDEKIALIASSFGREHNPGWYYNLKAHPECEALFRGKPGSTLRVKFRGRNMNATGKWPFPIMPGMRNIESAPPIGISSLWCWSRRSNFVR